MITSTFNKKTNTLETTFSEDIYANDVVTHILSFKDNTEYPRKLKTIITATNVSFKFSFNDLKIFNDAKTESLENYEWVATAIIINSAFTAAMSTLFETIANNKKYKFKVFCTQEAALLWLDSF